jgi:adenine nucleotide transporter 17
MYENAFGQQIPAFANLVVGYISEWSHLPFSMPIETIMVRLQKGATGGPGTVAKEILDESGISGFYPGIYTQIVWALKPAIEYAVFEQIKRMLLKGRTANAMVLGAFEAFFYGGVARAVATIITFPGNRAKMIMQGLKNSKDTTFAIELQKVIDEDGIAGLYNGIGPEIGRGVFSSAIKMMVKERIFLVARAFVYSMIGRQQ